VLATRSVGLDDGPTVVLLHGLGETMGCWERMVPLLEDRFRVVLVDLPGFGGSAGGGRGVGIEAYAEAVEAAVRAQGVGSAVVAGHSLGGAVAVALAERAPALVERLVLVNSPPTYESRLTARSGPEQVLRKPVVGQVLWRLASEDRMRAGLGTAFAPGFAVPHQFVADIRATSWDAFVGATTMLDEYLAERDLGARVEALSVPVIVVFGEQDARVDPESLSVFSADVDVVRIPEAGHTPIWETPERVAAAIN
jgi:pimeloyl-ACP methyl ester carboxylesterase